MGLTDAQRQRIEENRLKAQARLRERRLNEQKALRPGTNAEDAQTPVTGTQPGAERSLQYGTNVKAIGGGAGARAGLSSSRAGGSRLPGMSSELKDWRASNETGRETVETGGSSTRSCEGCGCAAEDVQIDQELLDGFGISVCRGCKLSREEFQCIPKKEAKDKYLLPEGTIAVLKCIERDNPHHSSWNKMKLFLRREVMEYSYKRWGSESALEEERARREALKYDRSLSRTKDVFKRAKLDPEGSRYFGRDPDDD